MGSYSMAISLDLGITSSYAKVTSFCATEIRVGRLRKISRGSLQECWCSYEYFVKGLVWVYPSKRSTSTESGSIFGEMDFQGNGRWFAKLGLFQSNGRAR